VLFRETYPRSQTPSSTASFITPIASNWPARACASDGHRLESGVRAEPDSPNPRRTRPWTTTGYATAQRKARSARRRPPPHDPTLTRRTFFSFCGGPNPCPLDQSSQAKHHHFDPRKQTPGGRLQIGTPAGFKSESVAGFLLECVAGFVGIRSCRLDWRNRFPPAERDFGLNVRSTHDARTMPKGREPSAAGLREPLGKSFAIVRGRSELGRR
jgi:hypothetical protein